MEKWLFEKYAGKVVARAAVTAAGALAGFLATKLKVHVDPGELSLAFIAGAHAAYDAYKQWRQGPTAPPPPPPAVQP